MLKILFHYTNYIIIQMSINVQEFEDLNAFFCPFLLLVDLDLIPMFPKVAI